MVRPGQVHVFRHPMLLSPDDQMRHRASPVLISNFKLLKCVRDLTKMLTGWLFFCKLLTFFFYENILSTGKQHRRVELNLESVQIPAHLLCNLGQVTQTL